MGTFAAALSEHPLPTEAIGETTGEILDRLQGASPELACLFISPHHAGAIEDLARVVRTVLRPDILMGCVTGAVIGGTREAEDAAGISLFAAHLPRTTLTPVALGIGDVPGGVGVTGWPQRPGRDSLFIALADPFSFPFDPFLRALDDSGSGVRVVGGLPSAGPRPGTNMLLLDDRVHSQGAIGVLLEGGIDVDLVVSQGCRPIGMPHVVTRAEGNLIFELAGRSALDRLEEAVASLTDDEREMAARGLHIGRVVDEHRSEFERGDFLVRNLLGADGERGSIAVGDVIEVGQTVQFHVRDAVSAHEDLRELLSGTRSDAALLFTCNGRGRRLFGVPDHDASAVADALGPVPIGGMFCAGEVGPVGGRNFVHGFTASLALFRA